MSSVNQAPIRGSRILVVEDETIVAMLIEGMLTDSGCEIVGPALNLRRATALATSEPSIDAAILDVNVGGQPVFPVAEILNARHIPFVFASGYGQAGLPREWRYRPMVQKPLSAKQLEDALQIVLAKTLP